MLARSAVLTGLITLTAALAYPCDVVIIGPKKVNVATEIVRNDFIGWYLLVWSGRARNHSSEEL